MDIYEIVGAINKETKQTDEKSKKYIGKRVSFNMEFIEKGKSFTMKETEGIGYIKTSAVNNCLVDGNDVYIETNNRIYKFSKR